MFEDYYYYKNKFEESFFNYTNVKNKYYEYVKVTDKILDSLYKGINNKYISNVILLRNINKAYEEYYDSLYHEMDIHNIYMKTVKDADKLINIIINIDNLYESSRISFLNRNNNSNYLKFLTLKELLNEPIIKNNMVYLFKDDLDE